MVWSNWQGAAWRGAMLVVLFWSGLALAQSSNSSGDRIMVVHEAGKATRCRILETWQLPDKRIAHLLQGVETGEFITIVDEEPPTGDPRNPRAMNKRIYAWGVGRQVPPAGSPIPPARSTPAFAAAKDTGIKFVDAQSTKDPLIINQADAKAPKSPVEIQPEPAVNTPVIPQAPRTPVETVPEPTIKQIPEVTSPMPKVDTAPKQQVIEFGPAPVPVPQPALPAIDEPVKPSKTPPPATLPEPARQPAPIPAIGADPCESTDKLCECPGPFITGRPLSFPRLQALVGRMKEPPRIGNSGGAPVDSNPVVPPAPVIFGEKRPNAPMIPADPAIINPSGAEKVAEGPKKIPSAVEKKIPGAVEKNLPSNAEKNIPSAVEKNFPSNAEKNIPGSVEKVAEAPKKSWRPGDKLQAWLMGNKSQPTENTAAKPSNEPRKSTDILEAENKVAQKKIESRVEQIYKTPYSTAMSNTPIPNGTQVDAKKAAPTPSPLSIPGKPNDEKKVAVLPPPETDTKPVEKRDMFGAGPSTPVLPPGKALVDGKRPDPLTTPERFNPSDPTAKKVAVAPPEGIAKPGEWPLNSQSVIAAKSGLGGPVTYIPYNTVTVPQPHRPPMPPEPKLPSAPELNAFVNAFSPPPLPKGQQPQNLMQPQADPMMAQMMQQQQMMQQMMMQQMMMQQQQMMAQQQPYGQPMMPYMPNPMAQRPVSAGPTMNFARTYQGPMPPNLTGAQPGFAPMPYPPMMAQQPMMMPQQQPIQQTSHMPVQQSAVTQQIEQLIKVMRESPYPAQREWAAHSLLSFEWRANPQIIPAMLQSASQDPAPSVRAGCVACLGRMQASVEPVFGTLHALRNDIDPRVRQEADQALVRLGQAPMAPQ